MSEVLRSVDDRLCEEILVEMALARPDLATILRVAIAAPSPPVEDVACLFEPAEAVWALGIAERVLSRHGRMA